MLVAGLSQTNQYFEINSIETFCIAYTVFNKHVTKQYINSIKIAKLSSPGKVNTRYVSGKDNGHIWLPRKDKVNKNSYIFHDLSVIFSLGSQYN